jgi:hypothetical protein
MQRHKGLTSAGFRGTVRAGRPSGPSHTEPLTMALNLIKVPTEKGGILIGVAQISFVAPGNKPDECEIVLAGGPITSIKVQLSVKEIEALANRHPPDGN